MNTAERIYREVQTLPEAQAQEVLNFLEFLQSKLNTASPDNTNAPKKNSPQATATSGDDTLPGFGMWSDREDMNDGAAYIRELRSPRYKL